MPALFQVLLGIKRQLDHAFEQIFGCMYLERHVFPEVYNVVTGFEGDLDETHYRSTKNGWRFDGLPWEQT
jgi:hypothetical protein